MLSLDGTELGAEDALPSLRWRKPYTFTRFWCCTLAHARSSQIIVAITSGEACIRRGRDMQTVMVLVGCYIPSTRRSRAKTWCPWAAELHTPVGDTSIHTPGVFDFAHGFINVRRTEPLNSLNAIGCGLPAVQCHGLS